jgi:hypothetical protein
VAFRDDGDRVTSPRPTAQELRAQGLELCAKHHYEACLKRLDSAKEEDPQEPPEVVKAREDAKAALEHGGGGAGSSP